MSHTKRKQAKTSQIITLLKKEYPNARCSLTFSSPWELLVATILSAQCTDKRVNKVTKKLFNKYHTLEQYANIPIEELEEDIRSTGFYHNKARTIRESARIVLEEHGGTVPSSLEELTKLPGVGRKTANVVLGNAFHKPGIVVDTHVKRIAFRLELTRQKDPVKIERELAEILPSEEWTNFGHLLISLGREYCTARKPECSACPLKKLCPQKGVPSHA